MKDLIPNADQLEFVALKVMEDSTSGIHVREMELSVLAYLNLPDEILLISRSDGRGELAYRLAWVRTKSKAKGHMERVEQSLWRITESGADFLRNSEANKPTS